MADENPVMEEPQEPTKQDVSVDEAKEVIAELEKLGIDSVEKVQNMATASSESGRLAQMLGEQRQMTENLQRQIEQLTAQPAQPQYDEYGQVSQPNVDINTIKQAVRDVYQNDILKPQVEQTNKVYGELSYIQNDPDYALVQEMWNKHMNSPQVQHLMYSGQSSPKAEYDKLVRTYYREALRKTHGALKSVVEQKATPPHVESGDQTHVHTPTQTDETRERIKKITDKNTGTDKEMEALVQAFLPDDDPILKR